MSATIIKPVSRAERAAWEPLWQGYLHFYEASQTPDATDVLWQRLHDPKEPMHILGAYRDAGRLLLFAGSLRRPGYARRRRGQDADRGGP